MEVITVTPTALEKFSQTKGDALGFNISVKGGGCAGLLYGIEIMKESDENFQIQKIENINFYFHPMVIPYLKGVTIDYSEELVGGGFKFINPSAGSSCGCGMSFGT